MAWRASRVSRLPAISPAVSRISTLTASRRNRPSRKDSRSSLAAMTRTGWFFERIVIAGLLLAHVLEVDSFDLGVVRGCGVEHVQQASTAHDAEPMPYFFSAEQIVGSHQHSNAVPG